MKLDRSFASEVKKVNGNGTREAKFEFLKPAREAAKKLSTSCVFDVFNDVIKEYGRSTVGICVAATVLNRQDRLEPETVRWAQEVMKLWTNKSQSNVDSLIIQDGLHPCKIEWYAGSLIKYTTAP